MGKTSGGQLKQQVSARRCQLPFLVVVRQTKVSLYKGEDPSIIMNLDTMQKVTEQPQDFSARRINRQCFIVSAASIKIATVFQVLRILDKRSNKIYVSNTTPFFAITSKHSQEKGI